MKVTAPLFLALSLLAIAACGKKPADSAYFNRGGPESLLDVSNEVVNLSVADANAVNELASWVKSDQPTRAELYCNDSDMRCTSARKVLDQNGVPTMVVPSNEYTVALVYERILARDCRQRYVDNSSNPWNSNHASYGCAIAANLVQHVSNKEQFIAPNIMSTPRANGAVNAYNRAYIPRPVDAQPYGVDQSLTSQAQTQ